MTLRIISMITFVSLIIAFLLSLQGVTYIDTGVEFYSFIRSFCNNFEMIKYEIPSFTRIPTINNSFIDVLINFANMFINIGNFLIIIINTIIYVVDFILAIIISLGQLVGTLVTAYGA